MTEIFNKSFQVDRRRMLRRSATEAEKIFWAELKNFKLSGYKFRRQYGIGSYVVDFYCVAARLAIEIDGGIHDEKENRLNDYQCRFVQNFFRVIKRRSEPSPYEGEGRVRWFRKRDIKKQPAVSERLAGSGSLGSRV